MPTRTRSQRIGDAAEDFVRMTISTHHAWVIRSQDRDFGIDFEAELAEPVGDTGEGMFCLCPREWRSIRRR
jgi:hypothetical protein